MLSAIKLTIFGTASFLFVFFGAFVVFRLLDKFKNLEKGFFHIMPYIILVVFALGTISSGRDFSNGVYESSGPAGWFHWVQRLTTIILLLASLERIINGFVHKRFNQPDFWPWLGVLFFFWFTTVFTSAVFSDHPQLNHEYFYPLVFFITALFLSDQDKNAFIYSTRNALIVIVLLSWLFALIKPSMVFHFGYSQGFIPGLPRFSGVAPHPVILSSLALLAGIFLMFKPFKSLLLNRFCWLLILLSIFMAQSKTIWVMVALFVFVYYLYIEAQLNLLRGKFSKNIMLKFVPLAGLALIMSVFFILFIGLDQLIGQEKLEQLSTLTGRDLIWAAVIEDAKFNSVFGYGPDYFKDLMSRIEDSAHMIHGHNQYYDTLAKAGQVGVVGLFLLTFYLIYKLIKVFSMKNSIFSFFIFLYLLIRSISEIPLTYFGYTIDLIFLISLIILLRDRECPNITK